MADYLRERLGLTGQNKADSGKTIGKLKSVANFFSGAIEAVKDTDAVKAIAESVPWWTEAGGKAFAEAVPPVKFVLTLFQELTQEDDPFALGLLACTLAYQRSVEEALKWAGVPKEAKKVSIELKTELASMDPSAELSFKEFSFTTALQHDFVARSDEAFLHYLKGVGYREVQCRQLLNRVHRRFVSNLKTILSHGKLKERFEPFTQLIELGTEEEAAYNAILSHIEYQRWQYEEAPVFGKEPFALRHVYIDTECGILRWGEIQEASRISESGAAAHSREKMDPFSERYGGRHDLVEAVLGFLADPNFNEAIVIQGAAGSGKSSFTLKLCSLLEKEGLYPIRIRLRDVPLDRHVSEALPKALFPPDRELPLKSRGRAVDDAFRDGDIFDETTDFRGAKICSYVLVLDGWDEISISASEGFKVRVARMLDQIRAEYLQRGGAPVRVILTGRPSAAVSDSLFLRDETPLLTIRPIRPEHLGKFVDDLREVMAERPVAIELAEEARWTVPLPDEFKKIFDRYTKEFQNEQTGNSKQGSSQSSGETGSLAVLGLPLLAHLSIRLISQWKGDRAALVENPTTLYRSMVDLTCGKSGKAPDESANLQAQARITGNQLRRLLQRTAAAMTIYGSESISYTELSLRLELPGNQLIDEATNLVENHELTSLMISFFFKGGHTHLGCEFLHKSFREYLFAEGIVETIKESARGPRPERSPRQPYWKDFDEHDPRWNTSRELAKLLAPQWLSPEVIAYIENLLPWEIERAASAASRSTGAVRDVSTNPLTISEWAQVRDDLADIWDWWAEGVHMRPQPVTDRRTRNISLAPCYAEDLVDYDAPFDRSERNKDLAPARITTMDSHLGDGLFRLCAIVHYRLAVQRGWLESRGNVQGKSIPAEIWEGVSEFGKGPRRCQSEVVQGARKWILFAPSGNDPRYYSHYVERINAAAWRVFGPFPHGVNASGVDLRGSDFSPKVPSDGDRESFAIWSHANLQKGKAQLGAFFRDDFTEVFASSVDFSGAVFADCRFNGADLAGARFAVSILGEKVTFKGAFLTGAEFDLVRVFDGCDFSECNAERAKFAGAWMEDSAFRNSRLSKADFRETRLKKVDFSGSELTQADFSEATLKQVKFDGAVLNDVVGLDSGKATQ